MSFEVDLDSAVLESDYHENGAATKTDRSSSGFKPNAEPTGAPTNFSVDLESAELDEKANQGFIGTFVDGAKSTGRAISSTYNTYTGDAQAVIDNAKTQELANEDKSQDIKNFQSDWAANTGAGTDDEVGLWGAIKGTGKAIIDNPRGAALSLAEQFPNSVPTLAGGWAGAKAGSIAGGTIGSAFAGVGAAPGAVIGGVTGFVGGMFLGNTLTETGYKAQEYAADGEFTPGEQSAAMTEGAKKAGVITAVDALTFGIGGKVSSTMRRTAESAVEAATRKTLLDAGVDISDTAALTAARGNPQIASQVVEAQKNAAKIADNLRKRAGEAGALLTMETVGEGLGEYLGELAATGQASVSEAVLESFLSLGQSSVQSMFNFAKAREKSLTEQEWIDASNGIAPEGMAPEQMPVADGIWDEPTPEAKIDMGQMQGGGVTPTPVFNPQDIDRNLGTTPSQQMGINPDDGPLSAAAAQSVDSGLFVGGFTPQAGINQSALEREGVTPPPVLDADQIDRNLGSIDPLTGEYMPAPEQLGQPSQAGDAGNYEYDQWGNLSRVDGRTVEGYGQNQPRLGFNSKAERSTAPLYEVGPDGVARPSSGEAARSRKERIDLSSLKGRQQTQAQKQTAAMPEQRSPEQQAQFIWDSMNTFERNAAAANVLGMRGVPAKNAATKAWDKLSSQQQAKLVTGLESQQGKRWIDPNQKVTDQTGPVLQNRDRTSQDSINQMRSISNNPDYSRLKTSGFLSDGAPVVVDENIQIPASQMGVTDTASAGNERFNVQYAVVEADQLMTSNSIDGTTNAEYQAGAAGKARAIAGNGRITGLQSAWAKGNASQYKADMAADRMHGIDPAVIEGMRNPVLVRLLPQDQVTDNIGDLSNRDEKGRLSPVEQAKTDMGRIDLDSLKFTADGAIGGEAIHQFRMAQPAAERVTEAEARKRLTSAIFQKAYGNDQLTEIQSGESDDAKSILSALAQAAPSMSRLEGAGEFDIRPLITQAGIAAVNAARRGTKLADYVQQSEMGIDPMVYPILEMMLNENGNIRSSKYIGEQLTNMAKLAYDEANSPSSDMFGEKPKRTAEQVIQDALTGVQGYGQINDGRGQESLGQRGRSEPDAQMVEGPEGGRERPADTRQTAPTQPEAEQEQPAAVAPWGDRSFTLYVDEEYGPPPPHTKAYEAAKSAPKGSVTHGLTVRPSGKQWHNLYLSHGNGDFSSVSVGRDIPDNLTELIEKGFSDYDNKQKKQAKALEEKNAISAKEIAIAKENNLVLGRELGTIIPNTGKQFKSAKIIADHGDGTFTLRGVQGNKQAELRGLSASSIVRAMDRQNLQSGAKSEGSTPETWRSNYIQAAKIAREKGIDPKQHKKLADLVAAIDASNTKPEAQTQLPAQQKQASGSVGGAKVHLNNSIDLTSALAAIARGAQLSTEPNGDVILSGTKIITLPKQPTSVDEVIGALAVALRDQMRADGVSMPGNPAEMTRDQFVVAYEFANIIPEFEITGEDIGGVVQGSSSGLTVDADKLYDKIVEQTKGQSKSKTKENPTKPNSSKVKLEASKTTMDEWVKSEIENSKYAEEYRTDPVARKEKAEQLAKQWRKAVTEAAKDSRIPTEVLDDIVSREGEEALIRTFRGEYEAGIKDYDFPTSRSWDKTYSQFNAQATPQFKQANKGKVKEIHARIVRDAIARGEPVPDNVRKQVEGQQEAQAPDLDLTQQTEETLAADAERLEQLQKEEAAQKAKQKAAESKQRERDADKARADEVVDDFQLGQSAEEVMSGMGDIFATESKPEKAAKTPAESIANAIEGVIEEQNAIVDDWKSREYKNAKGSVEFEGDGPSAKGSMSINAINEGRRRKAIEQATHTISAARKLKDKVLREGSENLLSQSAVIFNTEIAGNENPTSSEKDAMFEARFLRSIDFDGKQSGATQSNSLSKVMLVAVKDHIQSKGAENQKQIEAEAKLQKDFEADTRSTEELISDFFDDKTKQPTTKAPTGAIEDFGEKMAGAIKDQPINSLSKNLTDEEMASQPLSALWPVNEPLSIEDNYAAAFSYAARQNIPAKPRLKYKVKRWVDAVKSMREIAKAVQDGEITKDNIGALSKTNDTASSLAAKANLLSGLDRKHWSRIGRVDVSDNAYIFDDNRNKVPSPHTTIMVDGRGVLVKGKYDNDSVTAVIKASLEMAEQSDASKRGQFEIRQNRNTGEIFINRKGDKEYRKLKTFPKGSVKEARDFVNNNTDELVAEWEAIKERDNVTKADVRSDTNKERTGIDYRNGKDVTSEEFAETFGFRGVEFGNWVSQGKGQKDRQGMLNAAYDALLDLAAVVGIPPKAVSLNSSLGIAFGSRGKGKASAHYETDNIVINLTKTKGAGSLAHEWFHALDNYFSRRRGVTPFDGNQAAYNKANYITYKPEPMMALKTSLNKKGLRPHLITKAEYDRRAKNGVNFDADSWTPDTNHPIGVRPVVEKAFADLVNELDKSPMLKRSEIIDKGKVDGYWSSIIERAARSFESYVIQRLEDQGITNEYLANVVPVEQFMRDPGRYPYLTSEELKPVAEKFDTLFSTIETREEKRGNFLMFSRHNNQPNNPTTNASLLKNINDSYPALTDSVVTMLQRGRKGQKGGLVIVDSNNGADIAKAYSEATGMPIAQANRLFSDGESINGFYDTKSGITFLVGPNLDATTAPAVLLHEVTHSQQRSEIDARSMKLINGRAKEKNADLKAFLETVSQRMIDAGEYGNPLESTTYIVEQAIIEGRSQGYTLADSKFLNAIEKTLGSTVASIVRDFIKMVRQFALRRGLPINITLDDLVQYAMASVEQASRGNVDGSAGFSRDATASLEDALAKLDALGLKHQISERNDVITVSKIEVPEGARGQGAGSAAMQALIDYADATGKHIALTPTADFGGNKARLKEFYQRFGFKENKGKNKVYEVSEGMVRENPSGRTLYSKGIAEDLAEGEQQFAQTEKAYGGRAAYNQAKSEGKTKLNYQQWVQVRTPAFKEWFGDWEDGRQENTAAGYVRGVRSRPERTEVAETAKNTGRSEDMAGGRSVLHGATGRNTGRIPRTLIDGDTGEPRVFYHGTSEDIAAFELDHSTRKDAGWLGRGVYVASNPDMARMYANTKWGSAAPNIMPLFVRSTGELYVATIEQKQRGSQLPQGEIDKATRRLIKQGYDGAYLEFTDSTELVTYYANNVKSASGNVGTFSAATDDISFSRAQTKTAAFKKQFGDSKVVDASGDPLLVYHGSGAKFATFDKNKRGATTRAKSAEEGFFFTSSKSLAYDFKKQAEGAAADLDAIRSAVEGLSDSQLESLASDIGRIASEDLDLEGREFFIDSLMDMYQYDTDINTWPEESNGTPKVLKKYIPKDILEPGAVHDVYLRIENPYEHIFSVDDDWHDEGAITRAISIAKKNGNDGVILRNMVDVARADEKGNNAIRSDVYIAFEPDQIIQSEDSAGIRFSRSANPASISAAPNGMAAWDSPSASKFDDFVYKMQDKHVDTKRVIEAIRDTGKAISDDLDVYLQETLFHGRAAKRTQDFLNKEVNPLIEYMQSAKVEMSDLEEFLHARHAQEANALIAKRDPNMPDGGSGMTNAEAAKYLNSLNGVRRKQLENAAKFVDKIIGGTRETIVNYGLESQETVDGWTAGFKHYIPLQREDKDGQMGIGQGFSVKGKETKGRTGSTRKVVDILANVMMQRERAIVRGEKNRVAVALLGLAKDNPLPEFWQVDKVPTTRVLDKVTGLVRNQADPMYKSRDNAIVAKVNGQEHAILMNEDDPRAMRMAESLKNLDAAQLEGLLGATATATRYFAAVNTQYNPIFGVTNFVRDIQEAMLHLESTPLKGKQKEVFKTTFPAVAAVMRAERGARKGKSANGELERLWDDFQNVGGQTGFRDQFSNSADRSKEIQRALTPDGWAETGLGKFFTANGALKAPLEVVRKKAAWMFDILSDYNTAMENGVRLAVYKAGIDAGLSKQQSAATAKGITVNFNRKGQATQQIGALYAFFNASVQGSARLGQSLFDMEPGKPKTMRLSKLGQRIVSGGVLLGASQAVLLAMAGFDDEEPPEFIRERNIIIPTGGKTYISIPMPLGYHVIANLGRIPTEFALGGGKDGAKHLISLLDIMSDVYNPLGSSGLSMQTIAPTVLDPLAALAENKDFSGRAIAKESFNRQTPGHALARDTASLPATWLAQVINYATGGTEFTRGEFSPTPDQIDYLVGQLTGGVGRETTKFMKSIQATATGDDLPWHNIPLAGRFFGDADSDGAKQSAFYNNMDKVRKHAEEVKGLRAAGRTSEAIEYANKHPQAKLHLAARAAEKQVKDMRDRKRDLEQAGAPREEIRALEKRMVQRMEQFVELAKAQ